MLLNQLRIRIYYNRLVTYVCVSVFVWNVVQDIIIILD